MAKVITLVDDFDGKPIAEGEGQTVRFSLNDNWYEMDLSAANFTKLEKLLQPWADKAVLGGPPEPEPARRGRGPAKTTRTKVTGDSPEYRSAVRTWANANGMPTGDRGRIKQEIYDAYEAHLAGR